MRAILVLLLPLWSAAALAQTMYKCVDNRQQVTYSNIVCDKQGLKDAGPVADRTTTMPLGPPPVPPKPAAGAAGAKPPASKDDVETVQRGAQIKPIVPLLEKLTK
jgi:uncharacterized protein DUF4124